MRFRDAPHRRAARVDVTGTQHGRDQSSGRSRRRRDYQRVVLHVLPVVTVVVAAFSCSPWVGSSVASKSSKICLGDAPRFWRSSMYSSPKASAFDGGSRLEHLPRSPGAASWAGFRGPRRSTVTYRIPASGAGRREGRPSRLLVLVAASHLKDALLDKRDQRWRRSTFPRRHSGTWGALGPRTSRALRRSRPELGESAITGEPASVEGGLQREVHRGTETHLGCGKPVMEGVSFAKVSRRTTRP